MAKMVILHTTLAKLYEDGKMDADKGFKERYEGWQIKA